MKKYDEKFFVNLMIIVVSITLLVLAIYTLLSFIFMPSEKLLWYDYVIEIIVYIALGAVLFLKRKRITDKILS